MRTRLASAVTLTLALALAGCTSRPAPETIPENGAQNPPVTGPLAVAEDRPDGVPFPPTDVFGHSVGVGDDGALGVVWADTSTGSSTDSTRVGLGADPATWTVASPSGLSSYQDVGTPAVAGDGSVTALAVLRGDAEEGVVVLRVAPDGTATSTPVPGLSFSRYEWSQVDAVSDDGSTAVVAEQLVDPERPDDPGRLELTTVDLVTAALVGRTVLDAPAVALDVAVGPDGAVTVLVAAGGDDGARLLRLDRALTDLGEVELESPVEPARVPQLALAPDGTAVVTLVEGDLLTGDDVGTRVRTVAPGSTRAETVAELADRAAVGAQLDGNSLVTAIDGWAYLWLRSFPDGDLAFTAVDLGSGELATAVPTCLTTVPEQVTRSPSGSTVAAVLSCADQPGDVLVTLQQA